MSAPNKVVSKLVSAKYLQYLQVSSAVTSWRSESSDIFMVVLDKLLFLLSNPLFLKNYKIEGRQTNQKTVPTY